MFQRFLVYKAEVQLLCLQFLPVFGFWFTTIKFMSESVIKIALIEVEWERKMLGVTAYLQFADKSSFSNKLHNSSQDFYWYLQGFPLVELSKVQERKDFNLQIS